MGLCETLYAEFTLLHECWRGLRNVRCDYVLDCRVETAVDPNPCEVNISLRVCIVSESCPFVCDMLAAQVEQKKRKQTIGVVKL